MPLPFRSLLWLAGLPIAVTHLTAVAQASPSQAAPYCERVRARARIDSALLFAPKLQGQVVRNPALSDFGPSFGHGVQLRVGASWAPLDALRATRVLGAAEADCALHESVEKGERAAAYSSEMLLVDAYAAQQAALESSVAEREQLLRRARQRLNDHLITLMAFHDLQLHAYALARKYEEARGIVARARAQGVERAPEELDALSRSHQRASASFERSVGAVRALDPWTVRVLGGAIPSGPGSVDWYGWVELGYSLGGLVRHDRERRYERAKAVEVSTARTELPERVRMLRDQVEERVLQAQRELALVEQQLELVATTLHTLSNPSSGDVEHVRDGLVLERMLHESERAFLVALIASLSPLRRNRHDRPN